MSAPRCLYRAHGRLTERMFLPGVRFGLEHRLALGIVRALLDHFEMRDLRRRPGSPSSGQAGGSGA